MKDLVMVEGIAIKAEKHEIQSEKVIKIRQDVFRVIALEIQQASETEQEFLLFSDNYGGVIDYIVPVGQRTIDGKADCFYTNELARSPNNIHSVISNKLEDGVYLIGDFHCHPPSTGKAMLKNGLTADCGIGPSLDDATNLPFDVERDFGTRPLRIIGGVMNGEPMLRAYEILRRPTMEERNSISFAGETSVDDDDFQLEFRYTDYNKMLEAGIIRTVEIEVV